MLKEKFGKLNPLAECRELHWDVWECPPFLFLIMGILTIIAILATSFVSSRYFEDPEVPTIISATLVTIVFLIMGNLIITGFNKIAEGNRMKSEFISIISHQLRSPLSIFKWTVTLLEKPARLSDPATDASTHLKTLADTTEYMIRLVNSLLEVNRIEAHVMILKKEPMALGELVRTVIKDFEAYAHAANVHIECAVEEALPNVLADRDRLVMTIQNLLDNAIRYSNHGGIIMVSVTKKGSSLEFKITDSGVGIPPVQHKQVFQKFFRATNALTFQTKGTGIGLYIAKAIIEALGGRIGFISTPEKGSTFWFTLPLSF